MQKILTTCFLLLSLKSISQINTNSQWAWMKGDSISNVGGVYGTQGIASNTNKPSARDGGVSWTDASGNLWMFGGYHVSDNGNYGDLNDLWKYTPSTNQWTWMKGDNIPGVAGRYGIKGTPAPNNNPGAREGAVSWLDTSGNFWLFGGYGLATNGTAELNDLWKYSPLNNMWTWMKGNNTLAFDGIYGSQGNASTLNNPPPRASGVSWTDGFGNLWLFGGVVDGNPVPSISYNDLWKYDPFTNMWIWMKGDNFPNATSVYGTQGVGSTANKPGARFGSAAWSEGVETAGNLWLFGGTKPGPGYTVSFFNDLWKFDIYTNEWTWIKGDNVVNGTGVYGIQENDAVFNKPGARSDGASWKDVFGNFWLFGGLASPGTGYLNDLWKYNSSNNQWTWMKGDKTVNVPGVYGLLGAPTALNKPGGRGTLSWKDASDNLWLFGGYGYASNLSNAGRLNDLWRLSNYNVLPLTLLNISAQLLQNNILVTWQTSNEANTTHFIVERSADGRKFSTIGSVTARGNSSATIDYSFTDQQPFQTINFYRIKMVDADGKFTYSKVVSVKMSSKNSLQIFPNPAHNILFVQAKGVTQTAMLQITDVTGRKLKEEKITLTDNTSSSVDIHDLPAGVYYLLLQSSAGIEQQKFVKH